MIMGELHKSLLVGKAVKLKLKVKILSPCSLFFKAVQWTELDSLPGQFWTLGLMSYTPATDSLKDGHSLKSAILLMANRGRYPQQTLWLYRSLLKKSLQLLCFFDLSKH